MPQRQEDFDLSFFFPKTKRGCLVPFRTLVRKSRKFGGMNVKECEGRVCMATMTGVHEAVAPRSRELAVVPNKGKHRSLANCQIVSNLRWNVACQRCQLCDDYPWVQEQYSTPRPRPAPACARTNPFQGLLHTAARARKYYFTEVH